MTTPGRTAAARDVVVIIGVGGMGEEVARRQSTACHLVIADHDQRVLDQAASRLAAAGHDVAAEIVDVGDEDSVYALSRRAAARGPVRHVVHTAGLSPAQAPVAAILRVDLLGVALVLDAFGAVVADGGSGVVIASMAGHFAVGVLSPDVERVLATTPAQALLDVPGVAELADPGWAYAVAKRANQLRVQAASVAWGRRGARVNSVSPGVIATAMGQQELAGSSGAVMSDMVARSGCGRLGTADDVAQAVSFLLGPEASYLTGTDVLVDGGAVAGSLWPVAD